MIHWKYTSKKRPKFRNTSIRRCRTGWADSCYRQ